MLIQLSGVTRTLQSLIQEGVSDATSLSLTTSALPPDLAPPGVLSVYMFHAMESPDFKNIAPPRGTLAVPVRHTPMGLILQYVISMRQADDSGLDDWEAQDVIGYSARILHDFPVVDEELIFNGNPILHGSLHGQPIEFHLRPAKMEETVSFWGSEQNAMPRLSLFVEARVAILEPSLPAVVPGRVYSLGGGVVASMGPQLLSGMSLHSFPLPTVTGRQEETLRAVPPRPSLFDDDGGLVGAATDNNRVEFRAQGLAPFRSIVLTGEGREVTVDIDPPLTANAAWEFECRADSLSFRVRTSVEGRAASGAIETVSLVPGAYSLRVIQRDERLGGMRLTSNVCPLTLVPQVRELTIGTTRVLRVKGSYLPTLEEGAVGLMIDGVDYARVSTAGELVEETFLIDATGGDSTVEFVLSSSTLPSVDRPIAVNLVVNGVPATPVWMES